MKVSRCLVKTYMCVLSFICFSNLKGLYSSKLEVFCIVARVGGRLDSCCSVFTIILKVIFSSYLFANGKPAIRLRKHMDSTELRKTSNVKHLAKFQYRASQSVLVYRLPGYRQSIKRFHSCISSVITLGNIGHNLYLNIEKDNPEYAQLCV